MRFQSFTTLTSTTAEVTARPAEDVAQFITDVVIAAPSATSVSIKDGSSGATICRIPAPGSVSLKTPLQIGAGRAIVVQAGDSLASVYVTLLGEIRKEVQA